MLLCTAKEAYLEQTALNHYKCTEVSSYLLYSLSIEFSYAAKYLGKGLKLTLILATPSHTLVSGHPPAHYI